MQAILWPLITWLLREVVLKFVIFTALFAVVAFLVPVAVSYIGSATSSTALTSAFSAIPAGVWWFVDLFRFDYGVPICISAMVSKFLIRRLPVIG